MSRNVALAIVGGGPAAMAAARGFRAAGGAGAVVLVAEERLVPYRRPPLTKEFLRGEAGEDELPLEPPSWFAEHEVELLRSRAVALDPGARTLELLDGRELRFGQCVLATGAWPRRLPIPGADDAGVHVVRTVEHSRGLRDLVRSGTRVAVLGSGFIGSEAAASLALRGARVTVLSDEPGPQSARLGEEVASRLAAWLEDAGVELRGEVEATAIERDGAELRVAAESAAPLIVDLVVMATGVVPRVELARAAGLELEEGRMPADEHQRTGAAGVLAAGDACRARNATAGRRLTVEHWGEALAQGEVAGRAAAGEDARWDGVPGFWSTIGKRTLKHASWGDGHDEVRVVDHGGGAFTAWYAREGACVGVLTHERDDDYEEGQRRVAAGSPVP